MTRRMADSVNVLSLPDGFDAYAGYDDGHWPDAAAIAQRFPGKPVLRITVFAADDEGDCLDVENGDASPSDAPGWVQRRRAAGHSGPWVYMSASSWDQVRAAFHAAAVPEPFYFVAAMPGGGAVIPPGAVAHQWIDRGGYDESVVLDWVPGFDPVPPTTGDSDVLQVIESGGSLHVFVLNGQTVVHYWQALSPAPGTPDTWNHEQLPAAQ